MSDDVRLAAVANRALELLSGFSVPPSSLRLQAGDVVLEAVWPAVAGAAAPVDAVLPHGVGAEPDDRAVLRAPSVGVLYLAPSPGAEPFVKVNDQVLAGQQVAILEAMKLMMPVRAEQAGTIVEVLKQNGDAVEYGEPLFLSTSS
jgi:acetyl-CoA carboxylase biotin carboxyl carrier protein